MGRKPKVKTRVQKRESDEKRTESFRIGQPVKQLTGGSCFTGCFLSYDVPRVSAPAKACDKRIQGTSILTSVKIPC